MSTTEKGTQSNPYTWEEYETLANAGNWKGGYVKDESGEVAYMMAGVTVTGSGSGSGSSSGSGSGSDFEFNSYTSFPNPDDDDDDDDDDEGPNNPVNPDDNTDGNSSGDHPGSGGGGSSSPSVHNGQNGTFLQGAQFFSEIQMDSMIENGTWRGGNVYTLGYVGANAVINEKIPRIGFDHSILDECQDAANTIFARIKDHTNQTMPLAYVQAIERYNSGTGQPLYLNANSLGLERLIDMETNNRYKIGDIYNINLLNPSVLTSQLCKGSISDRIKYLSTALTLGNITLIKTDVNSYSIAIDTYDFDLRDWSTEAGRNIATILGHYVSENLSINIDKIRFLGWQFGSSISICCGLARRHILGTTEFDIHFQGSITMQF